MSSARVTSIEAVRDFKAALLIFCDEAKDALTSVDMETRRLIDWVQREQAAYWQHEIRRCQEEVAQAKADLFRKKLPGIGGKEPDCIEEKKALRLAQMRLEEAEDKLAKCQQWARLLPRAVDDYKGPSQRLAALVEGECPTPVAQLNGILGSLDAYTELRTPSASRTPAGSMSTGSPAPAPAAVADQPTAPAGPTLQTPPA